jgi:hypothetical protein
MVLAPNTGPQSCLKEPIDPPKMTGNLKLQPRVLQGGFCRQKHRHRNTDSKIGPGGRKSGRKPKENDQQPRKPKETQGRFQTVSNTGPLAGDADEVADRSLRGHASPPTLWPAGDGAPGGRTAAAHMYSSDTLPGGHPPLEDAVQARAPPVARCRRKGDAMS